MIKQVYLISVVDVKTAIPMIMGANIGTSMTSTLVSLTHIGDPEQVISSIIHKGSKNNLLHSFKRQHFQSEKLLLHLTSHTTPKWI